MSATAPAHPDLRPTPDDGAPQDGTWLTTVLRPAGTMTAAATGRFTAALEAVSRCSGVVLVDLSAVGRLPRPARRALAAADARLTASGGALVVLGQEGAAPVPLPPGAG